MSDPLNELLQQNQNQSTILDKVYQESIAPKIEKISSIPTSLYSRFEIEDKQGENSSDPEQPIGLTHRQPSFSSLKGTLIGKDGKQVNELPDLNEEPEVPQSNITHENNSNIIVLDEHDDSEDKPIGLTYRQPSFTSMGDHLVGKGGDAFPDILPVQTIPIEDVIQEENENPNDEEEEEDPQVQIVKELSNKNKNRWNQMGYQPPKNLIQLARAQSHSNFTQNQDFFNQNYQPMPAIQEIEPVPLSPLVDNHNSDQKPKIAHRRCGSNGMKLGEASTSLARMSQALMINSNDGLQDNLPDIIDQEDDEQLNDFEEEEQYNDEEEDKQCDDYEEEDTSNKEQSSSEAKGAKKHHRSKRSSKELHNSYDEDYEMEIHKSKSNKKHGNLEKKQNKKLKAYSDDSDSDKLYKQSKKKPHILETSSTSSSSSLATPKINWSSTSSLSTTCSSSSSSSSSSDDPPIKRSIRHQKSKRVQYILPFDSHQTDKNYNKCISQIILKQHHILEALKAEFRESKQQLELKYQAYYCSNFLNDNSENISKLTRKYKIMLRSKNFDKAQRISAKIEKLKANSAIRNQYLHQLRMLNEQYLMRRDIAMRRIQYELLAINTELEFIDKSAHHRHRLIPPFFDSHQLDHDYDFLEDFVRPNIDMNIDICPIHSKKKCKKSRNHKKKKTDLSD